MTPHLLSGALRVEADCYCNPGGSGRPFFLDPSEFHIHFPKCVPDLSGDSCSISDMESGMRDSNVVSGGMCGITNVSCVSV